MARYLIVPDRSTVWIDARSSLHPIHAKVQGVTGSLELEVSGAEALDLSKPATGRLELAVRALSSGNPLYDREMMRRIEASKHPVIVGELSGIEHGGTDQPYSVRGVVTFKGVARDYEDTMTIAAKEDLLILEGAHTFDVRDFGLDPPRIMMLKVYPDVDVRVEIVAKRDS